MGYVCCQLISSQEGNWQSQKKTIASQRQTNSDKCEQLKGELRETETQNKKDAKDANPTVIGNNNKESIASFSKVLISQI